MNAGSLEELVADALALTTSIEALVERGQAVTALRARQGRRIGAGTRERLRELRVALDALTAALDDLTDTPAAGPEALRERERYRYLTRRTDR